MVATKPCVELRKRSYELLVELNSPQKIVASLLSKADSQVIVGAKAGAHSSWAVKLGENTITDADVLGLAVKYTIAVNK